MLNTSSVILNGTETFDEAYSLMPTSNKTKIRYLKTEDGQDTGCYQISTDNGNKWQSPRMCKSTKDGLIPINIDSKSKLQNASVFYDTFTKPTHVGTNETQSWLVGDIDGCKLLNDEYNIQGMLISTIFDPTPKFYISFERIVCENQFGNLGKNSSSMYIDMGAFLAQAQYTQEAKDRLSSIITAEIEHRIENANKVYNKLAMTKLSDEQVKTMFRKLTVDTVAKSNEEKYHEQEKRYSNYLKVYDNNDNQNFKGNLFGFVNACTNINTRERSNPLDVIKPVLPAQVIESPCNFEYLCRAAMLNNVVA